MAIEEESPAGVPEWVIIYGDMMSLLMTFFIMLASMSEVKKNDKYQGVADAMEQQFGAKRGHNSIEASNALPRNTAIADTVAEGRKQRLLLTSRAQIKASASSSSSQIAAQENVNRFNLWLDPTLALSADVKKLLQQQLSLQSAGMFDLRVTIHSSNNPQESWKKAYNAARQVVSYLVEELKINEQHVQVSLIPETNATNQKIENVTENDDIHVEVNIYTKQLSSIAPFKEEPVKNSTVVLN